MKHEEPETEEPLCFQEINFRVALMICWFI